LTAPQAGGSRRPGGSVRSLDTAPSLPVIATLLAAGLALRLIIAYVLFPGSGFESDINSFLGWSLTMAREGPGRFYESAGFADYPPAYLYVLWLVGAVSEALAAVIPSDPVNVARALIKLPAIAADVALGYLLYRVARDWFAWRPDRETIALSAAAIYLLNPVTWYDSALWGQVDSVGALVMLVAVVLLVRGHSEGATAATVVAGLVKPQFGVVLAPLLIVILVRRHLLRPGSGPRPSVPRPLRAWLQEEQGPWRLISSAAAGLVTLVVLIVPFGLDLVTLVQRMAETAGGYPYLTVNAYDPWALFGSEGHESLAAGGGWSSDEVPFLGPLPGVLVGSILLVGGFLYGLWRAWRREGRGTIVMAVIFLGLAFFVLPTRVHERYLFPVFAFLPLLAAADRRWLIATIGLMAASFINLHGVLTTPLYGTPNVDDLFFGPEARTYPWVFVSAIGHLAVLGFVVWRWRAGDERLLEHAAALPEDGVERTTEAGELEAGAGPRRVPDLQPVPSMALGSGWSLSETLSDLRRRIDVRPIRADRSASLALEPRGRFDRLDLWIVALVILAALLSRTWRLAEPYEMHFDEVYHARTAAEFLQDWRYDIPHDIYEYTHPHMAKYLIAAGLVVAGDDRVTATSDLGTPVVDAAVERRWSPDGSSLRSGDRLYVATGTDVRTYDLQGRDLLVRLPLPAEQLVVDDENHRLFAAQDDGRLLSADTTALDLLPRGVETESAPSTLPLGTLPGPARDLAIDSDGSMVIALLEDGSVLAIDSTTGETLGRTQVDDGRAVVAIDPVDTVVVDRDSVEDAAAVASALAEPSLLATDARSIQDAIEATGSGPVTVEIYPGAKPREEIQKQIDAGTLAGVSFAEELAVAVATADGVTVLSLPELEEIASVGLEEPPTGMALVREGDRPMLYAASGETVARVTVAADERPSLAGTLPMPARVRDVAWDPSSKLVHVLGDAPEATGSTIYVIEANGNAVFADARLPFDPAAWVVDAQPERPAQDRQEILAFAPGGAVAAVDIGSHAFAWRLPGVLAGAATIGLLYLLTRLLFQRRGIALLVAAMALLDGMFFANARIAMNDTYVSLFIAAGVTLFAALWMGHIRRASLQAVALPVLGVILGLALASKWVGAYAIGGIVVLLLLRSGLGRILLLGGMVLATAVLGFLAISAAPDVAYPRQNYLFLLLLLGLTLALAAGMTLRPLPVTRAQLRVALVALLAGGAVLAATGLLLRHRLPGDGLISGRNLVVAGGALLLVAALGYGSALVLARRRRGPLALDEADDATVADGRRLGLPAWLDPGQGWGLPFAAALLCLTLIPLLVYIASYIPWAQPWHAEGPRLAAGWPIIGTWPPGHDGQAFTDLQVSMYDYHNNLRATHAASSPWWAWPLDLKPVWFYSQGLANGTYAYIYDAGNLVLFWLAIPAVAWAAWTAWARRSLALTLPVVMLLALWLPWARIDRATFQYHVFTSLPFAFICLAYLLAELWHGPSRRTWLVARVAGAAALLGAPLLWLFRGPLCGVAGTDAVNRGSQACGGSVSTAVGTFLPDPMALLFLAPMAILAWFALTARDSRRFAVVAMGAAALWFVAWYPNIAALPLPTVQASLFQVLLPTYNYDFQFGVNTDPPFPVQLLGPGTFMLLAGVVIIAAASIYAASAWRTAGAASAPDDGPGGRPEPGG
jgi:C-terminal four TMM region of protein-O-mannosyltransferase/Dolichyl-phosphate-mannose-protein mannosyltransferase